MWLKVSALVATVTLGAYTVDQVTETVGPEAVGAGAQQTFSNIANAAYYEHTLTGEDWATVLDRTVSEARNASSVTVDGTILYWELDGNCLRADVPTPDVEPVAVPCE